MDKLPLIVIGGYLGAGKTTLINRLLAEPHGARLLVMVNDFGAVNIDADLLKSATNDTIELTNGCVCCTMGGDLFLAMGDALDRKAKAADGGPEYLLIEASGIADPAKIAEAARAEPDMDYGGVAVLVDGENFAAAAADAQIGPQIRGQVAVADLLCVSKCGSAVPPALSMQLAALSRAPQVALDGLEAVAPLLLGGIAERTGKGAGAGHGDYVTWSHEGEDEHDRTALEAKLAAAPERLYRVKGVIRGRGDEGFEIHKVGPSVEIARAPRPEKTRLVGIGPKGGLSAEDIRDWWEAGAA